MIITVYVSVNSELLFYERKMQHKVYLYKPNPLRKVRILHMR